jgi:flagellar hook-associated protein 2
MELGLSGLASGFDWRAFVDQMVEVERIPQQRLLLEQNTIEQRRNAYTAIKTQLAVLQNRLTSLKDPDTFESRTSQVSDGNAATVSAGAGAPLGSYAFNFTQLATSAKLNGASNIGAPLSTTNDVSGVVLSSAGFATTPTAGSFTVNGQQVTVEAGHTLQDVFTGIEIATGGQVTASYDPATDKISLSSASEIVLGSAADTSNFLQAAKLYNNGTPTIASSDALGGVKRAAPLNAANFTTAITDGGSGAGSFKINGVEIAFNASTDSLNNVISRINDSTSGVLASYDQINDRIVLTNENTGDIGVSVEDVTGNFAAVAGLSAGTLERGKNLLYSINGGGTLVSQSNTISEESSSLAGITVTALDEASVTVTIGSDTAAIKTAIQDFITEYNKTQSIIETNTASSTNADGQVTAGTLAGESDANDIASRLRSTAYNVLSGFSASMNQLADLGIISNGNDNTLSLDDEAALDAALVSNVSGIKQLFADTTDGIAVKLDEYVEGMIGDEGSLVDKDSNLSKEVASITTQVSDLERLVQANKASLIERFVTMETAQAQINQQLQFLMQRFGGSSAAK